MKVDLLKLSKADLGVLTELLNRDDVRKWVFRDGRKRREWEIEIGFSEAKPGTETQAFGIFLRGDDRSLVGCVSLQDICSNSRSATINNLATHTVHQAIAAGREIIRYGFQTLNLNRIDCRIIAGNQLTPLILKWVGGGTQEGVLREMVYQDGEYKDVHIWSILRREWNGSSTA